MRGAMIVSAIVFTSGQVLAQDARVNNIFGPTQAIRRAGQVDFLTRNLTDQSAVRALVEATARGVAAANGKPSPGVYDAISVLARVPPDTITDPALRDQIVEVARAARGNSPDTAALVDLIEPRFRVAARRVAETLPQLAAAPPHAAPTPAPAPASSPAPARKGGYDYKITLGKLTAVALAARGSDKDYVTLVALGPDGEIGPFNSGVQELSQTGPTRDLNLRSDTLRVMSGQSTSLRMSWTAANHVSTDNGKLLLGLGNSAADLLQGIPGNPYALIAGSLAKLGLTFLQACDATLFGGAALLYTDRLVEGQPLDDWAPEGPNRWHRTFDYPNIASPCATGHYQLEVHIERQPIGS